MNDNNLIPTNHRTKSEAREIGKKGGKASGKRRREKREMKELLALAFDMDAKAKNGRVINNPVTGKPMSAKEASMVELVKRCLKGDVKAISLAADLLGETVIKAEVEHHNNHPIDIGKLSDEDLKTYYELLKKME